MALGADAWRVARLVAGRGVVLVTLGLAGGCLASYAAVRFLTAMLYEVSPSDPTMFASAALLVGCVGTVAAWIPARRAVGIDPSSTLKAD
jgi:putative ABC transport system permease protein